jgi:hypothetical protein
MNRVRKITKFATCERHAWLMSERRERRAEFFCEGGPADREPGCRGGVCRLWAGTDLFIAEVCVGEYPLDWAVPALVNA